MSEALKSVIETHGLSKRFGEIDAVQNLQIHVPEHSIVGFLGPNGSGKSTTIKMLVGLQRPTSGTARIFGLDLLSHGHEIRRRIGYLPQSPRFPASMTARQVLEFTAGFFFTGSRAAVARRTDEMLDLVGLASKADILVRGFSGGERQRLGIAQAQIGAPDLLILDEPAAALDPMGRQAVLEIMTRLRDACTIFYSTHILDDVERVSDRVTIISEGKLVTEGPIDDVLVKPGAKSYRIDLEGKLERAKIGVQAVPWVRDVDVLSSNGHTIWQVDVSDEKAAQEGLLRAILAYPEVNVLAFHEQKHELEDAFIALVQGEA